MTNKLFGIGILLAAAPAFAQNSAATYVGSTACKTCHPQIYARWSKTRMANIVLDPKEHPEAIIPDFSKTDPAIIFSVTDQPAYEALGFYREETR